MAAAAEAGDGLAAGGVDRALGTGDVRHPAFEQLKRRSNSRTQPSLSSQSFAGVHSALRCAVLLMSAV